MMEHDMIALSCRVMSCPVLPSPCQSISLSVSMTVQFICCTWTAVWWSDGWIMLLNSSILFSIWFNNIDVTFTYSIPGLKNWVELKIREGEKDGGRERLLMRACIHYFVLFVYQHTDTHMMHSPYSSVFSVFIYLSYIIRFHSVTYTYLRACKDVYTCFSFL